MDTGIDSIKIIVVVVVVLVQGGVALRNWLRKQKRLAAERDMRLGIPTDRDGIAPQTAADEITPDWDPFGEASEAPEIPIKPEPKPERIPLQVKALAATALATTLPTAEPIASAAPVAALASMHRVMAAHGSSPNRSKPRWATGSLRSMMLAKVILDRPVSQRGSGRAKD